MTAVVECDGIAWHSFAALVALLSGFTCLLCHVMLVRLGRNVCAFKRMWNLLVASPTV